MNAIKEKEKKGEKWFSRNKFWEKNKSCYGKHDKISISTAISEVLEDKLRNYWPEK